MFGGEKVSIGLSNIGALPPPAAIMTLISSLLSLTIFLMVSTLRSYSGEYADFC
jgi:hypothetical protein